MKAKKSYGQHFLNNDILAQSIADSLHLTDTRKVLEVGPGRGMLTQYLLARDLDLLVVEADRDMVRYLENNFAELKDRIIPGDFMKVDLTVFFKDQQFSLIGNYPYNISSQILFKMLEHREQIPEMIGMFQKEVADRVIAPPGDKTYGVISVLVQAYYEGEKIFDVKPHEFTPPPKVDSAVIRLWRKENQDLGCSYKVFRQVVKQAFSQRRKMLRNTMKGFLSGNAILEDEIFNLRPEKLSVEQFVELTKAVEAHREKFL